MKVDAKGTVQSFKEEVEIDEGKYKLTDDKGKIIATYDSDGKARKAMDYFIRSGKHKNLTVSMVEEVEIDEEIFYWYIIKGDLANGKIVYAGNEKQVKLKRHDPRFGDGHVMTKSRKMKKVGDKWKKSEGVSEEIEIGERSQEEIIKFAEKLVNKARKEGHVIEKRSATGYELYHKDFSSAMQHAYKFAKSKGFVIDPKEIDDKVATGPKKPSSGKTNRYSLKAGRKKVEIQVANLDNKRYELNMYIEGKDVKNPLNKIKEALTRIRSVVEKPESKSPIEEAYEDWLHDEAKKIQHKWKKMNTRARVQWLAQIKIKADKEDMSQEDLDEILGDYGLVKFPKEKVQSGSYS